MTQEITGKQVLCEFEALLRDAGTYLFSVGKRAYNAIKNAIDKHKKENADENNESNCDIVSADGKVICSAKNS